MTSEFSESSPDLMLELESTILSETTKFCLSFAYALLDLGKILLISFNSLYFA